LRKLQQRRNNAPTALRLRLTLGAELAHRKGGFVSHTLGRCRSWDIQRLFERAPAISALPPISDVLLSRSKRRSGPTRDDHVGSYWPRSKYRAV